MTFRTQINIQANTESEAREIAQAMEKLSGVFTAREWEKISHKLQSKINQARIKIFLS